MTKEEKHAGKRFATFCPMGPYMVIGPKLPDVRQQTYYNDTQMLDGRTSGYIWSVARAISEISKKYLIKKGDGIIMGAMAPGMEIQDKHPEIFKDSHIVGGDVIRVETEGLGTLIMNVVDEV